MPDIWFKDGTTKNFHRSSTVTWCGNTHISISYEGYETHFPMRDVQSVVIEPKEILYEVADSESDQARATREFFLSQ